MRVEDVRAVLPQFGFAHVWRMADRGQEPENAVRSGLGIGSAGRYRKVRRYGFVRHSLEDAG